MRQAVFSRAWTIPKEGNLTEQNEDAWRLEPFVHGPWRQGMLMALADGTTEAVYSGPWARTLVAAAEPDWPVLDPAAWEQRLDSVKRQFAPTRSRYCGALVRAQQISDPGKPGNTFGCYVVPGTGFAGPRAAGVGGGRLLPLFVATECSGVCVSTGGIGPVWPKSGLDHQSCSTGSRCAALRSARAARRFARCLFGRSGSLAASGYRGERDRQSIRVVGRFACRQSHEPVAPPAQEPEWRSWKHWLKSVRTWLRPGADEPASPPTLFAAPPGEFDASIARERGAESQPRLRNDDTTLIVCLPLESPPNTRPATVPEKIEELRQQFATGPVTVRPLQEAGIPESSRRWMLPWDLHESIA